MAFQHSKSAWFKYNTVTLAGVDSVSLSNSADPVDTTGIGDSAKSYISGIGDSTISVSGVVDPLAGQASITMWESFQDGVTRVWEFSPDNVYDYTGSGIVTQYDESASVGDKVTWSAEVLVTNAITRASIV